MSSALAGHRTRIQVRPDYTYQLSQLLGVGASAVYQTVTYDFPSDFGSTSRQDYDYWSGDGFLTWTLSPRTRLRTGAYVTKYETDNGLNQTDSTGVSLEIEHQWSETLTATAAVSVQRTDIERAALMAKDSSTDTGFTIGIERRGQVSQWRINAGRTFNPTGSGTLNETDQVRLQYDRNLTERLQFTGAVRANRSRPLGVNAERQRSGFLPNGYRMQLEHDSYLVGERRLFVHSGRVRRREWRPIRQHGDDFSSLSGPATAALRLIA